MITLEKAMEALAQNLTLEDKRLPNGKKTGALYQARRMVQPGVSPGLLPRSITDKFLSPAGRTELAKLMKVGEDGVHLGAAITMKGTNYNVKKVEILIGAAMTKINPELASNLIIRDAILVEGGKILAWMENGCKSNLVVLDVEENITAGPTGTPPEGPTATA